MLKVLNVKVLVGAFNQEKALVGAFSVIVLFKTDGLFAPLLHHALPLVTWQESTRHSSDLSLGRGSVLVTARRGADLGSVPPTLPVEGKTGSPLPPYRGVVRPLLW